MQLEYHLGNTWPNGMTNNRIDMYCLIQRLIIKSPKRFHVANHVI